MPVTSDGHACIAMATYAPLCICVQNKQTSASGEITDTEIDETSSRALDDACLQQNTSYMHAMKLERKSVRLLRSLLARSMCLMQTWKESFNMLGRIHVQTGGKCVCQVHCLLMLQERTSAQMQHVAQPCVFTAYVSSKHRMRLPTIKKVKHHNNLMNHELHSLSITTRLSFFVAGTDLSTAQTASNRTHL